jgi:hypothetical protein
MKTSDTILLVIAAGQITTTAIAEKLIQPEIIVAKFGVDLEIDGLATSHALGNESKGRKLVTWRITEKGKTRAAELTKPAEDPQLSLV